MGRKREFINNSIILLIGKFMTQFMSLLLLPLYTRYLITSDYGVVDLLQTYITLFIPVLTLRLDSALFRFLIDKRENEDEKKRIISSSIFILIITLFLTFLISIILKNIINIKFYNYFIINLIILMISSVLLQLLRGLGKNKEYSIASIITGFSVLILNVIMIVFCKCGAESIFISSSIGNIICIVAVIFFTKLFKYIDVHKINFKIIKKILSYSFPMIPTSLSWWIVNVSDRTIISAVIGTAFNGIYTISCKFSNILNSIYNIINMSWQETASLHINDRDRDEFFSSMINHIFMIFSSVSILILCFLPLFYNIVIGKEYMSSYNYIPILLYANSWNVLINLIGGIYIAKKKTKEVATTTIVSSIINIIFNMLLIKEIKLYAACISTLLSYVIMAVYRYYDCQKYVKLKINIKDISIYTIIFIFSSVLYYINNIYLNILNSIFIVIYTYFVNKKEVLKILNNIKNKLKINKVGEF